MTEPKKKPVHLVRLVYVDPEPNVRPWGYRVITVAGLDITSDLAKKGHLRKYTLETTRRYRDSAGNNVSVTRREFDWIAGRELENAIEALEIFGYVDSPRDVWVDHEMPSDPGTVKMGRRVQ